VKVQVIGDSPMPYGMYYHNVGKILDMSDSDAKVLVAIGRVREFKSITPARTRRVYKRRDMVAQPETEEFVVRFRAADSDSQNEEN
jgi:hypothetical protein